MMILPRSHFIFKQISHEMWRFGDTPIDISSFQGLQIMFQLADFNTCSTEGVSSYVDLHADQGLPAGIFMELIWAQRPQGKERRQVNRALKTLLIHYTSWLVLYFYTLLIL